jgi:hypothetical protein
MNSKTLRNLISFCLSCVIWIGAISCPAAMAEELSVLPSWKDGANKTTIVNFVADVTNPQSANFVEAKDPIAVFDNDGTLWTEKPCYFQKYFILYSQNQPNCSEESGQGAASLKVEKMNLMDVQVNEGMTVDEYKAEARIFLTTSKHERLIVLTLS